MLIRTQDQQSIYNMNNMDSIQIDKAYVKKDDVKYVVKANFSDRSDCYLGKYKTQEIALGILDNICKLYVFNKNVVYQMPEV